MAGTRRMLLGADLPVAWFLWGLPATPDKGSEAFRAWEDAVATRGLYAADERGVPALVPPSFVERLGPQRRLVLDGYFSALGWLRAPSSLAIEAPEPPPGRLPRLEIPPGAWQRAVTAIPPPDVKLAIKSVAEGSHVPPDTVWREWMISSFSWSWRVLLEDTVAAQAAAQAAAEPAPVPAGGRGAKTNVIPMRWPAAAKPAAPAVALPQDETLLAMLRIGLEQES